MRISKTLGGRRIVLPAFVVLLLGRAAYGQLLGARADESTGRNAAPTLDYRAIEGYITIEGKVEKRIDPTALRIVFALMSEQPTASACEAECRKMEDRFLKALEARKIGREAVAVDFISVLPAYAWQIETREGEPVAVEKRSGFRMQTNVHVQVPSEAEARAVLQEAFKLDIADVIAFDYWNKDLDRYKKEARQEALKVAQDKAELLLGAMFQERPKPMNVHEFTEAVYPRSLYASFENAYAQQLRRPPARADRMSAIEVAKPRNTYYRGLLEETDVQGQTLPLRPQISVVSTVRLYYATPVSKDRRPDGSEGKPKQ